MPQPQQRPRILIVENSTAVTGGLESILRSSVRLRGEFDFIFLIPNGSAAAERISHHGFQVIHLPFLELRKSIFSLLFYLPVLLINTIRFAGVIRRYQVALIHANDFYNLVPACYRFFGGRVRYVCHVRFMPDRFPKPLLKFLTATHQRYAASVITVSRAARTGLRSLPDVAVIPDGLPLVAAQFVPSQSKIFLYPANFTIGKGHDLALRAFALMLPDNKEWKLRFVGGDLGLKKNSNYRNELVQLSVDLGISQSVVWSSFSSDMAVEYNEARIVLNFSASESFSLTCQEALYFGRPVITTDSGGPAEIIDDGRTGMVVKERSPQKIKDAMASLAADASRCEVMGKEGMNMMQQRFGEAQSSDKLKATYWLALGRPK